MVNQQIWKERQAQFHNGKLPNGNFLKNLAKDLVSKQENFHTSCMKLLQGSFLYLMFNQSSNEVYVIKNCVQIPP